MFLGVMTKHHLVQIVPVATRARFWVRESFSAGRARSEMPAMTRDHYIISDQVDVHADIKHAVDEFHTFITGALSHQFPLAVDLPS
jgi:hypothetical protein